MGYNMLVKLLILAAFIGILISLGSSLFFLMRDQGSSRRTVNALTWRIGLSILLFLLILLGIKTGVIQPHGIYPVAAPVPTTTQ